jgi:hydroxyacyl-ACP dehydratase HTD2-like protein with hotdog domain
MTPLEWSQVREEQEIAPLVKTPTAMQLFMFSASSWNRHLIHYDSESALADGLANVAVHRALIGGFLAQMLSEWLGEDGRIVNLSWTVRRSVRIDEPLTIRGKVTEKRADGDGLTIAAEVWAEDRDGVRIAPGTALLTLDALAK